MTGAMTVAAPAAAIIFNSWRLLVFHFSMFCSLSTLSRASNARATGTTALLPILTSPIGRDSWEDFATRTVRRWFNMWTDPSSSHRQKHLS